jgi:hypothetical protein
VRDLSSCIFSLRTLPITLKQKRNKTPIFLAVDNVKDKVIFKYVTFLTLAKIYGLKNKKPINPYSRISCLMIPPEVRFSEVRM